MSEHWRKKRNIHLHKVLQRNGYDIATIRADSKELHCRDYTDSEQDKVWLLPFIVHRKIEWEYSESEPRFWHQNTAFKPSKTSWGHKLLKANILYPKHLVILL